MVKRTMDVSNRELQPINADNHESKNNSGLGEKVQMKKQLGLLEGVAIILGIIFGSGNFLLT